MQTLKMDFQSQSTPPVVPVMQSDAQSRFIGLTLYDGGVPYSAPSGAQYTVQYRGSGANNMGWYDTIQLSSGTRKAVVVSSSSPNVVTLELAEQALRVNGKVEVSLCVVNNTGYKLNTFPIICRVTGAPYVDPVAVRSYFYVTGLTSEQWLAYVTACQDAQKRAEDAAATFETDPTLSVEGKAADASVTGKKIKDITENISNENAIYIGEPGYRSFSKNGELTYNADWSSVKAEISDVLQDYGVIISNSAISSYEDTIPSLFFVDSDGKSILEEAIYKSYNDVYFPKEKIPANAKYICLNRSSPGGMTLRRNTVKKQLASAEENSKYECAYSIDTTEYTRAASHFFPLKVKKGDIVRVKIGSFVQVPNQYSLCLADGYATKDSKYQSIKPTAWVTDTIAATYTTNTANDNYNGFFFYCPDENNDPQNIKIFVKKTRMCSREKIIIAANNASEQEKEIANIVCDGKNDELDFQNAIDLLPNNGTIELSTGDFYFDSTFLPESTLNRSCVCAYPKTSQSDYTITGKGRRYGTGTTTIHVDDSVYGDSEISVINGAHTHLHANTGVFHYCGLNINNLKIVCNSGAKNGVMIDLAHCGHGVLNDIFLECENSGLDYTTFKTGMKGIRAYNGYSTGTCQTMDRIYAGGFSTAFQLGGEHVVCTNLGARMNYMGYSFGAYEYSYGTFDHPITLINCCDEHSCLLPQFVNNGVAYGKDYSQQEIDMISFNIEIDPSKFVGYAKEIVPNSFCGKIEYTIGGTGKNVTDYWKLWEKGSGHLFETRNMAMKRVGDTATRLSYTPEYNQSYYDTEIGKMLWYIDDKWIDAVGNNVN